MNETYVPFYGDQQTVLGLDKWVASGLLDEVEADGPHDRCFRITPKGERFLGAMEKLTLLMSEEWREAPSLVASGDYTEVRTATG